MPVTVTPAQAVTIAAGANHACMIRSGTAYCWGDNTYGELGNGTTVGSSVPVAVYTGGVLSGVTLTQITTGTTFTCALSATGTAYCWGLGTSGQLGNAAAATSSLPVAVTASGVLSGVTLTQISSGGASACALSAAGAAYCWGAGGSGQLGNGTTTAAQSTAVAVTTSGVLSGVTLTQISSGGTSACALSAAGAAYCWGAGGSGQLGNGTTTAAQSTAVAVTTSGVLSGVTLTQIDAGTSMCVLSGAGAAYCWGAGGSGQLGNGTTTATQSTAVAVSQGSMPTGTVLAQITVGNADTCVLSGAGAAYCWGAGGSGQLGNGTTTAAQSTAVAVTTSGVLSGVPLLQVTSGTSFTCALGGTGSAYCWGLNSSGQLGNPATAVNLAAPAAVMSEATMIASGYTHACAISGGKAYCWGDDTYGELGNNTTTATPQTTAVAVYTGGALSGVTLTAISAGQESTCALSSAGNVYCWGLGTSGQLGNNLATSSSVPVEVDNTSGALALSGVTQVSVGSDLACAVGGGAAYCWGAGSNGQLGNNATGSSDVPVAVYTAGVLSGVTVTSIAAGNLHACATGATGAAYCWGYGGSGQLGNNATGSSDVPVAVYTAGVLSGVTLTSVATTGGANNYMCALSSAGQAYCWGYGSNGQLGNSATSSSDVPVAVTTTGALSGTSLISLTTGYDTACALSVTGAAYCWGDGGSGALGNNTTTPSSSPVAVYTGGLLSGITLYQISGGESYSCVQDGTPYDYCWGLGSGGQLGDNSTTATNSVAVYVAPQAPTGLGATMGATTATVSWTAPAFTNSGTITGYTATTSPSALTCTTTGATSCTITGLTASTSYTITVTVTASPTGSATSSPISVATVAAVLQLTSPTSLTWSLTGSGINQAIVDSLSGDQQLTATDNTGSGAGWHITVSATTFTAGTHTLPNTGAIVFTGSTSSPASTSAPSTACVGSCTLPADTTAYPLAISTAASSPASYTVYDTQAGTGLGQVTIGRSSSANPVGWWAMVPGSAYAGSYTTTVTLQVVSGP